MKEDLFRVGWKLHAERLTQVHLADLGLARISSEDPDAITVPPETM
jgi:hypothetical protein